MLFDRLNPYMLYIKLAGLAFLVVAGWYSRGVYERSKQVDAMNAAISERIAREGVGFTVGMDLETGLNKYHAETLQYDRKVSDAISSDSGNRFDVGSVQRTAQRIAAGEAARKRAQ